jgi:drug/metabolite transporter (DMT)-like permease
MPLSRHNFAVAMLALATLWWGMGFVWAKNVGEAVNAAAGVGPGGLIGPNLTLAVRFGVATALWACIFPRSLRGWGIASVRRSLVIGGTMFVALELQHLGLDRASEATTAFLTSLTVVVVPLLVAATRRKRPDAPLVVAIAHAVAGIYLLTGATLGAFGPGEWLGIACAVGFGVEILSVNALVPRDDAFRMTLGMFAVNAAAYAVITLLSPGFLALDWPALATPPVLRDWACLAVLGSSSFAIMTLYQPRVEPTRAAVIYMIEPIFAAAYAWAAEGAVMTQTALIGATLILFSNIVAEFRWPRRRPIDAQPA